MRVALGSPGFEEVLKAGANKLQTSYGAFLLLV